MAFLALAFAVVLIVAAIRNTYPALFGALKADVPNFAVWGAAIFALSLIGFLPGLKPVSRGLLWLVVLVIILKNYEAILSGFQTTWQGASAQAQGSGSGGSPSAPLDMSGFNLPGFDPSNMDWSSILGSTG